MSYSREVSRDKGSKEPKVIPCKNSDNDPSWYAKNSQLLNDAAAVNTTNVSGYPVSVFEPSNGYGSLPIARAVPGILTLSVIPSIGTYDETNATSAVNLAAKNIYSYVRHANSGSANYDAPDLMMAILAADQVFSAISMAVRAYGIAMNYNQLDRYTPVALLRAMGFDPDSVINNMAQFRYYINQAIARASVIWVPSDMSIVARHYWLYSNVYRDSEDHKAQYYMYVPANFLKFEPTAENTGSSLSVVQWGTYNAHSIGDWFNMITSMLDPIISDEDLGIMFGDMLKAYGSNNLFTMNQIPDNYTIIPVHNPEVLSQIHNATTTPVTETGVSQKNNVIYQKKGSINRNAFKAALKVFNFWQANPDPSTVMVSSRLRSWVDGIKIETDGKMTAGVKCGTEYVNNFALFYYDNANVLQRVVFYSMNPNLTSGQIGLLSKFDWMPQFGDFTYTAGSKPESDTFNVNSFIMDLDNYTEISTNTVEKMHNVALFSEFGVPKSI